MRLSFVGSVFLLGFLAIPRADALPDKVIVAVQPNPQNTDGPAPSSEALLSTLRSVNKDIDIQIYECPWARCLKAIETGAADIVDDLYLTDDRLAYIHYLQPPYSHHDNSFRFYVNKTSDIRIDSWQDLYHLGLGTVRGYVYFPQLDSDEKLRKHESVHISQSINLLLLGRIDAIVAAPTLTDDIIRQYDPQHQLVLADFSYDYAQDVYIGVSKQSPWFSYVDVLESALKNVLYK
ncbi:substrate-binding periplasmic protein [Alteromonas facilis]|uniref:substrate-binding periplasmic protein n=1 Tax=Alteromonas facilis TaxID=2048004 RepID=UPI000C293834|nr:transporter substrate-binding domain-containing protein [Alteromonas facilis]